MIRLNITVKVWLSIGIFVLGFVFSIAFVQIQGRSVETRLRITSEALFPAALWSQRAESAFERTVKTYRDAVLMQDPSGLDSAAQEGRLVIQRLRALEALPGLTASQQGDAAALAASVEQFLSEARNTYSALIEIPTTPSKPLQQRMIQLAERTNGLRTALLQLEEGFSNGLRDHLDAAQADSAKTRWLGLITFTITLIVSAALVNYTIRRSITGPLLRAEAELAHERDLLRILLDNVPDCIYFKDDESRFIRVNKAQSVMMGVPAESSANGRTDADFFDEEYARQAYEDEQEIVRSGAPIISKMERVKGPAGPRWLTTTKAPVRDANGHVHCIVGVSRDITDWKEAVEALETSEKSFRLLFAGIPHAVWVYDRDTLEFLEVNDTAVRHYGYTAEEFASLKLPAIHTHGDAERLRKALAAGRPLNGPWQHQTKDGEILDVEVSAQNFEFQGRKATLAVAQDVTERKRLELELQQAQRLESVGQLAAGIAHEINTPIQYVGDNLRFLHEAFQGREILLEKYERLRRATEAAPNPPEELVELRQAIENLDADYLAVEVPRAISQSLDGVGRVGDIVRAMKEFAHPGQKEKAMADLNKALANALIVMRNELKYVAEVETDFGELPPALCHIAEMNQVFLNLLVNAAHAIQEVNQGTQKLGKIVIRTRQVDGSALITISDTGCGIPPNIKARVFDPFFTTKAVGRGTGQGLAISRSIVVEKHGGTIKFEPNGEQGTTFIVTLPLDATPAFVES
jgi:two-component system NtrC family sensor kinase